MKKAGHIIAFIIAVCPLLCPAGVTGADISHGISIARNGFRDGDAIKCHPLSFTDTVSSGGNRLWDLTGAATGRPFKTEVTLVNDSLKIYSVVRHRMSVYYRENGDTLQSTGFENNQWRVEFTQGEPYLLNPMTLDSGTSCDIQGQGIYCDRLRYCITGTHDIGTDATGTLILPEGDTITNVRRVHERRIFLHRFSPIDSLAPTISREEFDKATAENRSLIYDMRRWYAPGYRYPLLETRTLQRLSDEVPMMAEACYTPLIEMEGLPSDPGNMELRRLAGAGRSGIVDAGSHEAIPSPADDMTAGGEDVRYDFTHSAGDHTVSADYRVSRAMDVEFILADVNGITYSSDSRRCQPGERYRITISYRDVPGSGPFVLYICSDVNRYSEKFRK